MYYTGRQTLDTILENKYIYISPHQNKKALSLFHHKKYFLIENKCMYVTVCVSNIHFLSKISKQGKK